MLLDDPTSSLDNKVTSNIINRICRHPRWSQKTYIISTRKISVLKKMDKVIFMEDGKVSFFGPFEQLKDKKEFIEYAQEEEEKDKKEEERSENSPESEQTPEWREAPTDNNKIKEVTPSQLKSNRITSRSSLRTKIGQKMIPLQTKATPQFKSSWVTKSKKIPQIEVI